MRETSQCYQHLLARHRPLNNRFLRNSLKRRILPGLALYLTLLQDTSDRDAVLAEIEFLFKRSFFVQQAAGIRLLGLLSDPFPLVRVAMRIMTRNRYLPGAQEVVEDSADCFAVNTYRCFILDTLADYNASELTILYCKTDDWLSEALPGVRWQRTTTLAAGGDCCDFRWSRMGGETVRITH